MLQSDDFIMHSLIFLWVASIRVSCGDCHRQGSFRALLLQRSQLCLVCLTFFVDEDSSSRHVSLADQLLKKQEQLLLCHFAELQQAGVVRPGLP